MPIHNAADKLVATGQHTEIMGTVQLLQGGASAQQPAHAAHMSVRNSSAQDAYSIEYSCGRRCSYTPLGGLTGQPVTIAGYTLQVSEAVTGRHMFRLTATACLRPCSGIVKQKAAEQQENTLQRACLIEIASCRSVLHCRPAPGHQALSCSPPCA